MCSDTTRRNVRLFFLSRQKLYVGMYLLAALCLCVYYLCYLLVDVYVMVMSSE